jgi:hypothetical protein
MHFICCNVYILVTMIIIESVLYIFRVNFIWSALSNIFLLMKLVSSALPYVVMCAHHRFEIVDNIVSGIFKFFDSYINLRLENFNLTNIVFNAI